MNVPLTNAVFSVWKYALCQFARSSDQHCLAVVMAKLQYGRQGNLGSFSVGIFPFFSAFSSQTIMGSSQLYIKYLFSGGKHTDRESQFHPRLMPNLCIYLHTAALNEIFRLRLYVTYYVAPA
jgi:hypothetical protein